MKTQKLLCQFIATSFFAYVPATVPAWAGDEPSVSAACVCYNAKKKRYTAHLSVDDKTRAEYETLIKNKKMELGTHVKLVPGTCSPEMAEKMKLEAFKCTKDMYHTGEVIVRISSTGGIPRIDDADGNTVLDMTRWPEKTKISISGKKPK